MNTKTILCSTIISCCAAQAVTAQHMQRPQPHLLVYKTKTNCRNLVPVVLSEDGSKIVSYPAPQDIKAGGSRLQPTPLHKGYLLDNSGVGANTAFINMTREKYAVLTEAPSASELFKMITHKDPITILCDCGIKSAFKNPAAEINKLIDSKTLLKTCTAIKKSK